MKKIINRLRRQPEEVRRHVLHIFIFIAAIFMIMLWILSLGKSLTNSDTQTKIEQDLKPFSVLKDNLVNGYKSTQDTNSSSTE